MAPLLFRISSHFLYFFWSEANFSTSIFFFIFPKTLSVYKLWVYPSKFLYCSLCWSSAWAIFSKSAYLRANALSAYWRLFIIFPSFYLALCRDFFNWIEVYGYFLTLYGYFFTAARYFSSISSFLFTALSIYLFIFSCAFNRLSYFNSILWSYFVNS